MQVTNSGGGFWDRHGASMVEYLILAGVIGVFVLAWQFKDDLGDVKSDNNVFRQMQIVLMEQSNKNRGEIAELKTNSVSRSELVMTISSLQRSMERIEDKLESRTARIRREKREAE